MFCSRNHENASHEAFLAKGQAAQGERGAKPQA
jgi:hypothetical protein